MQQVSLHDCLMKASREKQRKRCAILVAVGIIVLGLIVQMMASVGFLSAKDMAPSWHPSATAVKRLQKKWNITQGVDMTQAIIERQALLRRTITLSLQSPEQDVLLTQQFPLLEHPTWFTIEEQRGLATISFNQEAIETTLAPLLVDLEKKSEQSCDVLSEKPDRHGVMRIETSCIAKSGWIIDRSTIIDAILLALSEKRDDVEVVIERSVPTLSYHGKSLTLLGAGRSNFHGSGLGRKANVRKALSEKVHNVLVPAGSVFSFNDTLGGPVTKGNGWQDALTIFEGVNLRMAPGGGVCQASTTTFRAALRAGLPILEQKNHSLYVHYYEAYGVGQDATIFPGKQDMKFLNDTGHDLILQSYYEGEDAYVNLFGIDDGRMVTMEGPFFASTQKAVPFFAEKPIRTGEVAWVRTVKKIDGSLDEHLLRSRYQALPRSLPKTYAATTEITKSAGQIFHAAAPQEVK
jgi:vancomycin resistance protein YoaR